MLNKKKEARMKLLRTSILIVGLLSLVFYSQVAVAQKSEDDNSIPYPLEKWKGVQGKTLADSKPYFVGQRNAPDGAPNV
ncbi:MAG: hypothetical protein P8Y93_08000, partial [Acidobacteriota bacterium]